jgi:hypothetical protein
MVTLCDHQTGYLPWLGLFHRISLCDIYVSLDTVKFTRQSWDDRNKIKTPDGTSWLKVPTKKGESAILKDILINNDVDWVKNHLKSIEFNYGKAEYFKEIYSHLEFLYGKKKFYLMELNETFLRFFLEILDIKVKFYKASDLDIPVGKGNQYLIDICKVLNADSYVFGQMGKNYADAILWRDNNIRIAHHEYIHPEYRQLNGSFIPYLSIIDLLMNEGPQNSKKILLKDNIHKDQLFHS